MKNNDLLIKINLLPPELRKKKRVPFLDRILIYVVLSLILLVVVLVFVNMNQKAEISKLEKEIIAIEKKIKQLQPKLVAIEEAKELKEKIKTRLEAIQILEVERPLWVNTMQQLSAVLPKHLWYGNFNYNSKTSVINLSGSSYSLNDIAQFLVNLENSKYFSGVSLKSIDKKTAKNKVEYYTFSLNMTLIRDQSRGKLGEFKIATKKKPAKKKDENLKAVDLAPKGKEQLETEKDRVRSSVEGIKK